MPNKIIRLRMMDGMEVALNADQILFMAPDTKQIGKTNIMLQGAQLMVGYPFGSMVEAWSRAMGDASAIVPPSLDDKPN